MKLSVIVPVYNLERTVSATLDSLLAADFPHEYEIVAVNDGSEDNSRGVIEQYRKSFNNLHLIDIPNGGVSNARNVGLRHAAGEYITFVDGDDTVEKDFFKTAVSELDAGGYDFVQTNLRLIRGDRSEFVQFNPEDESLSEQNAMLARFFGAKKTISNSVCGKVFRAERIRDKEFDSSLKIAEDQKFVFDSILSAQKIRLLATAGYNYYQRSDSAMHALDKDRAGDILRVLDYCLKKVESGVIRSSIEADRLDVLMFVYHETVLSGENGDELYREILDADRAELRAAMGRKERWKLRLLKADRKVYDRILIATKGSRKN